MFQNERIIAKFCLFRESYKRLSGDSCDEVAKAFSLGRTYNAKSKSLLRAWISVIKCFNICQCGGGGRVERESAKIRSRGSNFESQVKRDGGKISSEDGLSFLMGGILRVGRNGLKRLLTGSIKIGAFITAYICAHPMVWLIWNLRTGKPTTLRLQAVDSNGILCQIELTSKKRPGGPRCIEVRGRRINYIQTNEDAMSTGDTLFLGLCLRLLLRFNFGFRFS